MKPARQRVPPIKSKHHQCSPPRAHEVLTAHPSRQAGRFMQSSEGARAFVSSQRMSGCRSKIKCLLFHHGLFGPCQWHCRVCLAYQNRPCRRSSALRCIAHTNSTQHTMCAGVSSLMYRDEYRFLVKISIHPSGATSGRSHSTKTADTTDLVLYDASHTPILRNSPCARVCRH